MKQIEWGQVTFHLDNPAFLEGFVLGRHFYFEECNEKEPECAQILTSEDILGFISVRDVKTGRYHLDYEGLAHTDECLGAFLGYATGPLFPETVKERAIRLEEEKKYVVVLPDTVGV